jgi:hypothetical protein
VCASAGEGPGVLEEDGEAVVGMGTGIVVDADVEGGGGGGGAGLLDPATVVGVDGLAVGSTASFSRRRFVPRDVLSLRPSDVALIKIWCL